MGHYITTITTVPTAITINSTTTISHNHLYHHHHHRHHQHQQQHHHHIFRHTTTTTLTTLQLSSDRQVLNNPDMTPLQLASCYKQPVSARRVQRQKERNSYQ